MIYTLEWLEKEANDILSSWNGSDKIFIDRSGEPRNEDDVTRAQELFTKVNEIKGLIKELHI